VVGELNASEFDVNALKLTLYSALSSPSSPALLPRGESEHNSPSSRGRREPVWKAEKSQDDSMGGARGNQLGFE